MNKTRTIRWKLNKTKRTDIIYVNYSLRKTRSCETVINDNLHLNDEEFFKLKRAPILLTKCYGISLKNR